MLLAELRAEQCEGAAAVWVIPWIEDETGVTWTVSHYDTGSANADECQVAMEEIVPRFQSFYDLVQKH